MFREKRYRAFCSLLKIKDSDRILDVGCGHGISFEVFNQTNKIVGVDLNEPNYEAPNFEFIQADAAALPLKNEEFDIAISIGCFEHVRPMSKLDACIREINRVARKGLVVVPCISTLLEPHFHKFFWHLRSYEKRRNLEHKTFGFERAKQHEKLNYLTDDGWLNFDGFKDWKTKRYWHIQPLIRALFIFKK